MQKDMSVEQLASIAGVSVDQIKEWIGNVNWNMLSQSILLSDTIDVCCPIDEW